MGCARDIVEHVGVPRFFYSEFPLGHSAGKPHDENSQLQTLAGALRLFATTTQPRTTMKSDQIWSQDDSWEKDFLNIQRLSEKEIEKLREDYKQQRATAAKLKNLSND